MKHLALLLPALLLTACASAPDAEPRIRGAEQFADDPRLGEPVNKICFASRIDSFGETTRDTVVVEEGRDHYLLVTHGTCFNLRNAQRLGIKASDATCLRTGDRITVSDSLFNTMRNSLDTSTCTIREIYEWDPKATAAPDESTENDSDT